MGSRQSPHTKPEIAAKQLYKVRLAQALRDNLHRRKAQARARSHSDKIDSDSVMDSGDQNKQ